MKNVNYISICKLNEKIYQMDNVTNFKCNFMLSNQKIMVVKVENVLHN